MDGQLTRGKRYFITFNDDYSRYCYVYLLTLKDKPFVKCVKYKSRESITM